jgi:hypothetical protein
MHSWHPICGTCQTAGQGISTWVSPDRYFIEVSLCLMKSKTSLVSLYPTGLYYCCPSRVVATHDPWLTGLPGHLMVKCILSPWIRISMVTCKYYVSVFFCIGKIHGGQDRVFLFWGGPTNYKAHYSLSWFRPLLGGNSPTSNGLILKMNNGYNGVSTMLDKFTM